MSGAQGAGNRGKPVVRASVIIVTYNSARYIRGCLESVFKDLGRDDEVIVVDNGSTDGTAAIVEQEYPAVRLVRGRNTGYAGGNNRGATEASGAYLIFLNPDTAVHAGAIEALLAPLGDGSDIGLTTARLVYMDRPTIINACGNTIHFTGLTYCRGAGRPRDELDEPAEVDAVSGAAFAIGREVYAELGGFDEHFFMYVEDTDLCWRGRLLGYRCLYVPDAVVEHDYHPAYSPRKAFYLDYNRHVMLLKNCSRPTYARMLPGLLLAEIVTWGFLVLQGPRFWPVKLRVYYRLWKRRASIAAMRRAMHARRRRSDSEVMRRMEYRLDFGQLADPAVARFSALVFHPAFRIAHMLVAHG